MIYLFYHLITRGTKPPSVIKWSYKSEKSSNATHLFLLSILGTSGYADHYLITASPSLLRGTRSFPSVSTSTRLFFSKVKCQHNKDFCDTRTSSTIFMIHEVFLGPQNPNQFPNVPWVLAAWGHDCFPGETVPCPGKAPCLNTQPDHPFHGSTPLPRVLLLVTR